MVHTVECFAEIHRQNGDGGFGGVQGSHDLVPAAYKEMGRAASSDSTELIVRNVDLIPELL